MKQVINVGEAMRHILMTYDKKECYVEVYKRISTGDTIIKYGGYAEELAYQHWQINNEPVESLKILVDILNENAEATIIY